LSYSPLFDHLIRPRQHIRRNCQADLLRGLEIDDQLELLRLLDREISGLCAFQNLVHIRSSAPEQIVNVWAVGHEPPVFHIFWSVVCRWKPVLYREVCELCSLRSEYAARQQEDSVSTPLACGSKCGLNILGT